MLVPLVDHETLCADGHGEDAFTWSLVPVPNLVPRS
jgi:hypothetical protein